MNIPKVIGITGGIGAGKSTICKILEMVGAKIYCADDRAKQLMEHHRPVTDQVKALFGSEAYLNGKLNRKQMAKRAFENKSILDRLNAVVHPAVKEDFERWVAVNNRSKLLVKEAALLFETGSYKELDATILVSADEKVRIKRVLARDSHRSYEDVKAIISKQTRDENKKPLADYLIDNNGDRSIIEQTLAVVEAVR